MNSKTYPRTNDFQTVYLNTVIKNPAIMVGDYTIYNDYRLSTRRLAVFYHGRFPSTRLRTVHT
ncbi:antibiotic acetyltransferase, partial [Bacteroides ovatus]|nr:antibiotic acetyltransferase [Bacteroides ovatus]